MIGTLKQNEHADFTEHSQLPCSEYSGELQSRILCIHGKKLPEPILDIGCGKGCEVVQLLRKKGISICSA